MYTCKAVSALVLQLLCHCLSLYFTSFFILQNFAQDHYTLSDCTNYIWIYLASAFHLDLTTGHPNRRAPLTPALAECVCLVASKRLTCIQGGHHQSGGRGEWYKWDIDTILLIFSSNLLQIVIGNNTFTSPNVPEIQPGIWSVQFLAASICQNWLKNLLLRIRVYQF